MTKQDKTDQRLAEMMACAQKGDQKAYRALLFEVRKIAQRFARARIANAEDIDEVVQEVLIAMHHARHTFEANRAFLPWFFAIANYKVMDHLRALYRRKIYFDETAVDITSLEDLNSSDIERLELVTHLDEALKTLPSKQRSIIESMHIDGKSVRELSEKLKISSSAIKVTAHRGYLKLRKLLRKECDDAQ